MTIRELADHDLPRITEIAQRGMEFDEINPSLIREKTIGSKDYDPSLGLVFEQEGRVVGFAQGAVGRVVEDRQRGHVRLLVVDRPNRMQGVGSALLQELELRLKSKGVGEVTIMDSPLNYLMPGVDFRYTEAFCFLQKHKYEFYRENHNLVCDLDVNAWPGLDEQIRALQADAVEIRRARVEDKDAVFQLLDEHWPAWKTEVSGSLENNPVSLYIAFHEGRCIAFSGYQGNNKSLSWFGPMGTLPVLRGKGIGSILLRLCLRDLARQGFKTAIIPWVGPVRFYVRFCNARFDRCFWAYKKVV